MEIFSVFATMKLDLSGFASDLERAAVLTSGQALEVELEPLEGSG